jgi:uncharacterized protein
MSSTMNLSPALARRLFLAKQRLAGPPPEPTPENILKLVRDLGCLQIDPISAVERTHRLVLFSRLGHYDRTHLDQLLWQDRSLFEYWAHCASIVPTEDYALHQPFMRNYPWGDRTKAWIKQNQKLKNYVLREIRKRGPLPSRALTEEGLHPEGWVSTGWTSGRNVSRMLDFLWIGGQIMVAGRDGMQKLWDLSERVLPEWAPRERLSEREVTRRAAQRAIRALGVCTPRQINWHFTRSRYPGLPKVLAELEAEGKVRQVAIEAWKGQWYLHADDEPLLDELNTTDLEPRTTLLSPFDNLICDRARTRQMFDFDFVIEIYVPAAKRKWGYYVLPILHNEQLIGRIDPLMNRATGTLSVNAVFAEPGAPRGAGAAVAGAIRDLATFLGARDIHYNRQRLPAAWKKSLLA